MKKELRDYQSNGIKEIYKKFKGGKKRIVFQLPTGGGKTITSSFLIHSFLESNPNHEVLFFVHRIELFEQFRKTFESQFPKYEVGGIDSKSRMKRFDLRIHVCMVETALRRLKSNPNFFGNKTGLIVIDECHNSSFDKLFEFFPKTLTVGLTATPIRLSKKNPMNLTYNDIVTGPTIERLINDGALSPNKTFVIDNQVNYSKIKKNRGDFSGSGMFEELSKKKHITNVVKAYEMKGLGRKTLIFNASIEHSEIVNKAFLIAGYNSKHLDGATNKAEREKILEWFHKTPDAILQNMGVLTMGFDEPSIETVIMNRPTTSLALWLQCTGRGSRRFTNKDYFTIIDLGDNTMRLGDWSADFDWKEIYENAIQDTTEGEGVAPVKYCPVCSFLMAIQTMRCPECGHEFTAGEIEEDNEEIQLKLITDNFEKQSNVYKITNLVKKKGWNKYAGMYMLRDALVKNLEENNVSAGSVAHHEIINIYLKKCEDWCKENEIKFNNWHRKFANEIIKETKK